MTKMNWNKRNLKFLKPGNIGCSLSKCGALRIPARVVLVTRHTWNAAELPKDKRSTEGESENKAAEVWS